MEKLVLGLNFMGTIFVMTGLKPAELIDNRLWFHGPSQLIECERKGTPGEMPQECVEELRASERKTLGLLVSECVKISDLIRVDRYSSLTFMLQVTAIVLRFIENLRLRVRMREHVADEVIMMKAELMWIKEVQLSLIDEGVEASVTAISRLRRSLEMWGEDYLMQIFLITPSILCYCLTSITLQI